MCLARGFRSDSTGHSCVNPRVAETRDRDLVNEGTMEAHRHTVHVGIASRANKLFRHLGGHVEGRDHLGACQNCAKC